MKVTPIDVLKSVSGKVCSHSDTYVSLNSSSGKMYTGKVCHPYEGEPTQNQLTQQQAFKTRALQVSTWLNANKPSTANGANGTAAYQEAQRIKRERQLSNVRQVVELYMNSQGVVTLPSAQSGSTTSGGGTSSGGGSTSGGGTTTGGGGTTSGGDGYGD